MAEDNKPLADELGVKDMSELIRGGHGRLFSTAGPQSPVVELTDNDLIIHPPDKPYQSLETSKNVEEITIRTSARGVLLNELGEEKHIPGAKYNSHQLWCLNEYQPGTTRAYAAWFDDKNNAHKLLMKDELMTVDLVFKTRNRTHDGELNTLENITSED